MLLCTLRNLSGTDNAGWWVQHPKMRRPAHIPDVNMDCDMVSVYHEDDFDIFANNLWLGVRPVYKALSCQI